MTVKHLKWKSKMKIKGLQKTTLIDYPGKIACTIFLFGCNFRCGFCHNPELVLEESSLDLSEKEILEFLEKRKNQLEGVCFTGGEPLLSLEKDFVKKIKERGYLVKIDTNGTFPERLEEFISKGLVDYIAMDIKNCKEKYSETAGAFVNLDKIEKSVGLIINSGLDYEFRTTVVPGLHEKGDFEKIGKWMKELSKGKEVKKYWLQGFSNQGKFIDSKYKEIKDLGEVALKKYALECNNYFKEVGVRG